MTLRTMKLVVDPSEMRLRQKPFGINCQHRAVEVLDVVIGVEWRPGRFKLHATCQPRTMVAEASR